MCVCVCAAFIVVVLCAAVAGFSNGLNPKFGLLVLRLRGGEHDLVALGLCGRDLIRKQRERVGTWGGTTYTYVCMYIYIYIYT